MKGAVFDAAEAAEARWKGAVLLTRHHLVDCHLAVAVRVHFQEYRVEQQLKDTRSAMSRQDSTDR